jgi:hypothetical protein
MNKTNRAYSFFQFTKEIRNLVGLCCWVLLLDSPIFVEERDEQSHHSSRIEVPV